MAAMNALASLSDFLDRIITRIGEWAAWLLLPTVGVILFDVITRRFFVLGSTKLQEGEWHLHTALFTLCLGYAYLKDAHVRIDLVRERLHLRTKWWIELFGCLLFLLPYCVLILYYGYHFVSVSFEQNEVSAAMTGLSHRWMIKAFVPAGFLFLAGAGICVLLRRIVLLFGPRELRHRVASVEDAEHADLLH
jgi:TRAP-type mannitol/chloroaromatic compound transport system permease small subunit